MIPGRSMSGKSTLTRELTLAGATYYSDEFAPVLPDGRVLPYPKPLSVRRPEGDPAKMEARMLGWREELPAVPVVTIAAVHYDPKATSDSVGEISKADAVVAMLDNTVSVMRAPERCLSTVAAAVRNARCLGGRRPGAAEFASALLRELCAPSKGSSPSHGTASHASAIFPTPVLEPLSRPPDLGLEPPDCDRSNLS